MKEKEKYSGVLSVPELLIPAGGMEQLRAAAAAGADAVYLSGTSFNARANADNFRDEDLEAAIKTAHEHGIRVHIALNTLLRTCEMEEALSFARRCRRWGADALILQDRGLTARLREEMPDIALHLSTQGTVYDADGVSEAVKAGFQRVILSRELSLEEIAAVCRQTDAEIEIFVHGAVCISYSGQCHMSYAIGGRSGNRGTCAQPCRLPYTLMRQSGSRCEEIPRTDGKYLLSPADMCLLGHLKEIAEAGVASLKIEGRMKSPEYVSVVTGIYRNHLDRLAAGEFPSVTKEEYEDLCTVFNRGGMTDSYLRGDSGPALMSCDVPKHRGIPAGRVISCNPKKRHVVVRLSTTLSVGDGIEIRSGGKHFGNVVTYLNKRGDVLRTAHAEETVTVGDIEGNIRPGSEVFKISDRELKKRAVQAYQKIPGRIPADIEVSAEEGKHALLRAAAPLWRGKNGKSGIAVVEIKSDTEAEHAQKKVLRETDVLRQMEKMGETPYFLNRCNVSIEGAPMVPSSSLNALRRRALKMLTELRLQKMQKIGRKEGIQPASPEAVPADDIRRPIRKRNIAGTEKPGKMRAAGRISLYFFDTDENETKALNVLNLLGERMGKDEKQNKNCGEKRFDGPERGELAAVSTVIDIMIPWRRFLKNPELFLKAAHSSGRPEECDGNGLLCDEVSRERKIQKSRVRIIPYLPAITKGYDHAVLRRDAARLEELKRSGRIDAVLIAQAGQRSLFSDGGSAPYPGDGNIVCFGDENFNVFNMFSAADVLDSGIGRIMLSNELPDEDITEILSECSAENLGDMSELEILAYGRIPVMYTEHCTVGMPSDGRAACGDGEKKYYCRQGDYFLRDRKGADFPLICDCSVCRMEVLSHRVYDKRDLLRRILKAIHLRGMPAARVYIYNESAEQTVAIAESLTRIYENGVE